MLAIGGSCVGQPVRSLRLQTEARSGKSRRRMPGGRQMPQMPTMPELKEEDGPQYMVFVKSSRVPIWYPVSMMGGGPQNEIVEKAIETDLGKKLYEGQLEKSIAESIYKDMDNVKESVLKQYSELKFAKELEFGYKFMDPKNPKQAFSMSGIKKLPTEEELNKPVTEKLNDAVENTVGNLKQMFSGFGK